MTSATVSGARVSRSVSASSGRRSPTFPSRTLLVGSGILAVILAGLVIGQALRTYTVTLDRFQSIAENSTAKVDAAEAALQNVADMDANAAVFVATAADNPIHWKNQQYIHDHFQMFREQMFIVRSRLDNPGDPNDQETAAYNKIEYFSFDQFWQHLGNLLTAQQNADNAAALDQYVIADNYLQNQISRYLLTLEALNFKKMQDTKSGAASAINAQVVLLGFFAALLAIILTAMSFWLRGRVRRILTPGIDAAMVLGWLLLVLMLAELLQTPRLLNNMVDNAYYNVSATARTLAVAKLANSAQSGSVIDPGHAAFWQSAFDANINSVALRLCGYGDCLTKPFTARDDSITDNVRTTATNISSADSNTINGIAPLVANVKYEGAATALEQARQAFNNYTQINAKLRILIKAGNLDDAARLATGTLETQSGGAFKKFVDALSQESLINRGIFDNTWHTEQTYLPQHQLLFGLGGYVLLILAVALGVYHRSREL